MDSTPHSLLAGVFATPSVGTIANTADYRRYVAPIHTSTTLHGNADSRTTRVVYEVGVRSLDKPTALAPYRETDNLVDVSYATNAALVDAFSASARKYSNFSGSFARSSLAGLVERIARGLAFQSITGEVTSGDLSSGQPYRVTALGAHDTPVTSMTSSIYIPRVVDTNVTQDVWAILVAAAAGCEVAVVTDVLFLDPGTNTPIIPFVYATGFAPAAVSALQLLGANMVASGQGPLFALAVTVGVHAVLSVVGHTDEGAITRDVLRTVKFGRPFGGVTEGVEVYTGLPTLNTTALPDVSSWCDSIALLTASATAYADPGVFIGSTWFPAVLTDGEGATESPGDHTSVGNVSASVRGQLLNLIPLWAPNYVRAISAVFGTAGDPSLAAGALSASALSLGNDPRHLRYISAAPFFWVEPTSLLPPELITTAAAANLCGSLCDRDSEVTRPAIPDAALFEGSDVMRSFVTATIPSARRLPLLHHLLGHQQDGVAFITFRQLDVERVVHPGGNSGRQKVADRVTNSVGLDGYLWTRGQSPFPAPGELLLTNPAVGLMFAHLGLDATTMDVTPNHIYSTNELVGAQVTVRAVPSLPIWGEGRAHV